MPVRFRRVISLGKGLRLNLSKKGFSLSQKMGNVTINTRGRATANIPGTGISFTTGADNQKVTRTDSTSADTASGVPSPGGGGCCLINLLFLPFKAIAWVLHRDRIKLTGIIALSIIAFCCSCLGVTAVMDNLGLLPTNTATLLPSQTATPTFLPAKTPEPTATLKPEPSQTSTTAPTPSVIPAALPTDTVICSCSSNLYDCSNFTTQNQAQACFDYCRNIGYGDIHNLDGNPPNNRACESLP